MKLVIVNFILSKNNCHNFLLAVVKSNASIINNFALDNGFEQLNKWEFFVKLEFESLESIQIFKSAFPQANIENDEIITGG
jgi:hypothetical protein